MKKHQLSVTLSFADRMLLEESLRILAGCEPKKLEACVRVARKLELVELAGTMEKAMEWYKQQQLQLPT